MQLTLLKRLLKIGSGLRKYVALGLIITFFEVALGPIVAHLIRLLTDSVFYNKMQDFSGLAIAGLAILIVAPILVGLKACLMGRIAERCARDLRELAVEKILDAPISDINSFHSGELLSRLTNDVGLLKGFLQTELFWMISLPAGALLSIAYLLSINWLLTVIILVVVPILFALASRVAKPMSSISYELQQSLADQNSVAQDVIGGTDVIRAFNLQGLMGERSQARINQTVTSGEKMAKQQALVGAASVISGFLPFMLAVGLGGYFVITGKISVGSLIAFVQMLNGLSYPMTRYPVSISVHRRAMVALSRILEVLDIPAERKGGAVVVCASDPVLEVENLVFGYGEHPVLNGVNFSVNRGETIAIVGRSGAGKSTLFKLLVGFYQQSSGFIRLFGTPLEEWDLNAARQQIAFVEQNIFLFPGTIAENIALGNPAVNVDDIVRSSTIANAHTFIAEFPDGYNHFIGERGKELSGGQRQRLAIARAIILDTPLLLLDEATAALDPQSEKLVNEAIASVSQQRTCLIIAHRLSTICNADRILVVDNGKIAETGSHQQLLAEDGIYSALYSEQYFKSSVGGAVS